MFPSFLVQSPRKNGSRFNHETYGSDAEGEEKARQGVDGTSLYENEAEEDGDLQSSGKSDAVICLLYNLSTDIRNKVSGYNTAIIELIAIRIT